MIRARASERVAALVLVGAMLAAGLDRPGAMLAALAALAAMTGAALALAARGR